MFVASGSECAATVSIYGRTARMRRERDTFWRFPVVTALDCRLMNLRDYSSMNHVNIFFKDLIIIIFLNQEYNTNASWYMAIYYEGHNASIKYWRQFLWCACVLRGWGMGLWILLHLGMCKYIYTPFPIRDIDFLLASCFVGNILYEDMVPTMQIRRFGGV